MTLKHVCAIAAALAMNGVAFAQSDESETGAAAAQSAEEASPATEEAPELNPDESADLLNSQQQLQQTFTLQRTINGEVVESDRRTVTFSREQPHRETEAGQTMRETLKARFDSELLTRNEAFEEAKLDFTIADVNRDGAMSAEEFASLVDSWRKTDTRQQAAPDEEVSRQRRYEDFLAEISPETAAMQNEAYAKQKFSFMAGASETIALEDYIREYLLDFDSMDTDNDGLLSGPELERFRALNRGETIDM